MANILVTEPGSTNPSYDRRGSGGRGIRGSGKVVVGGAGGRGSRSDGVRVAVTMVMLLAVAVVVMVVLEVAVW